MKGRLHRADGGKAAMKAHEREIEREHGEKKEPADEKQRGGAVRRKAGGGVLSGAPKLKFGGKVHGKAAGGRLDRRARGGRMTPKSPLSGADVREMDYEKSPKTTADEGGLGRAGGGPIILRADGGRTKGFHPGGEKGKLHREMGIPESQKIPKDKLSKAAHSGNPEIRRDAIRAQTMAKWHHG